MEDTLEPCHLRLVLSTSLIALALAAVNITKQKTILLDLLITLGESVFHEITESTTRVLRIRMGTLIWRLLYEAA